MDEKQIPSILIADDDDFLRLMVRYILEPEGFKVIEACDGDQALVAAQQHDFSLILMDAVMPVMDGFTACTHLHQMPGTSQIPIIIVTALDDQASVDRAFRAGATDYVTKPLQAAVLRHRVRHFIQAYHDEMALKVTQARLQAIVNQAADAIITINPAGLLVSLNPAAETMFGYTAAEVLGQQASLLLVEPYSILESQESGTQEIKGRRRDGSTLPIELSINGVEADQQTDYVVVARDISERKRVQDQLLYQANLLQNVSDAIVATDMDSRITSWNHEAEALYGWSAAEAIGKPVHELLQTRHAHNSMEELRQRCLEQGVWKGEVIQKHRDGTAIEVLASVSLIKNNAGSTIGAVSANRDNTERKRAEAALAQSKNDYQTLADYNRQLNDISILLSEAASLDDLYRTIAESYRQLTGAVATTFSRYNQLDQTIRVAAAAMEAGLPERLESLVGSPLTELTMRVPDGMLAVMTNRVITRTDDLALLTFDQIPPQTVPAIMAEMGCRHLIALALNYGAEVLGTVTAFLAEENKALLDDALKTFAYMAGLAINRKKADDALRESEARYRHIFENATEGIFQGEPGGYFVRVNPAFARMAGYNSPEEFLAETTYTGPQWYANPQDRVRFYRLLQDPGFVQGLEMQNRRKDGTLVWVSVDAWVVWGADGEIQYYEGIVTDITGRKQVEETLRASETFNRAILNAMDAHIAVLDKNGTIVAINEAWEQFARTNGGEEFLDRVGVGANYLAVCTRAAGEHAAEAQPALAGIQAVLAGQLDLFTLEYPCHSPEEKRWFLMRVTPLPGEAGGGVMAHTNITERVQAEEAVRYNEKRYRTLFQSAPIPLEEEDLSAVKAYLDDLRAAGVVDFNQYFDEHPAEIRHCVDLGQMINVNQAAVSLYEAESQEVLLNSLAWITQVDDYADQKEFFLAMAAGKTRFEKEVVNVTFTGARLQLLLKWTVLPGHETTYDRVIVSAVDVTALKLAEATLQNRVRQQAAVAELSRLALTETDLTRLFDSVVNRVAGVLEVDLCNILELLPDGEEFLLRAGAGWQPGFVGQVRVGTVDTQAGYVLRTRQPVIVTDLTTETRFHPPVLLHHRVISNISVPIESYRQPFGVLGAHSRRPRIFTSDDIYFLQAVANVLAEAITRQQTEQALQHYAERLEGLHQIDQAILTAESPVEIAQATIDHLKLLIPFRHTSIALYDFSRGEAGLQLTMVYNQGPPKVINIPLKEYDFPLAQLRQGQVVVYQKLADMARLPQALVPPGPEPFCQVFVPLVATFELIGTLNLSFSQAVAFTSESEEVAREIADQLAVVVQNARYLAFTRQHLQEMVALQQASLAFSQLVEPADIGQRIIEVIEHLGYRHGTLSLVDPASPGLHLLAYSPSDAEGTDGETRLTWIKQILSDGQGICGWAARYGQVVWLDNVREDSRYVECTPEINSELCIPLQVGGRTIGVLNVESEQRNAFTEHDERLLSIIASQAAVALDNARLFKAERQAAERERQRLARELHDVVSQSIFSAKVIAEALPRIWDSKPELVLHSLEDVQRLTRGALAEMRTLLLDLRPEALAQSGLMDLLRQLGDALSARIQANVSLEMTISISLPLEVKIAFYRIAQETLNNIVKHARASEVIIQLVQHQASGVTLIIQDNGVGFDPNYSRPGRLGLGIMRERAASIGATFTITSRPDGGTEMRLAWSSEP